MSRRRTAEWRNGAAGSTTSWREHRRKRQRLTRRRHAKFKAPGGMSNGHRARSTPPAWTVGRTPRRLTSEHSRIWKRHGPGSVPQRIEPTARRSNLRDLSLPRERRRAESVWFLPMKISAADEKTRIEASAKIADTGSPNGLTSAEADQ